MLGWKVAFTAVMLLSVASTTYAQQVVDDSVSKVGEENAKAAMAAVMERLKDPMSAQFKSFSHPEGSFQQYPEKIVCGMVNAKNGFGGYNGFVPFGYHIPNRITVILSESVLSGDSADLARAAFKSLSCASVLGVAL